MFNQDTELLFPSRVIPELRDLRTETWRELVSQVMDMDESTPHHLAFVLMMVSMGGCVWCNADSIRALRGCTQCARQTIRRFRGQDQELVKLFQETLKDVEKYLQKKPFYK